MSKSASRARLVEIIRKRSFGRGEITLASGRKSNFYFNLKPTMLDAEGAALLARLTLASYWRRERLAETDGLPPDVAALLRDECFSSGTDVPRGA